MTGLDDTLRLNPDVLSRTIEGETVMVDLGGGTYYGLNEVGTRIWQLLGEGRPLRAILTTLLEEYEVAPEVAERELLVLIAELEAKGLVQRESGPAGA